MEYYVYCRIKKAVIRNEIEGLLKNVSSVFCSGATILIDAADSNGMEHVLTELRTQLVHSDLDKEDVIYVFYPQHITEVGMYQLKQGGSTALNAWEKGVY